MIYVCVPIHNEVRTAGLVLWKVRQVFTAFQREYDLLVCDDASTDGTSDVLASYGRVLPMTVVTHRERQGYARSLQELLRLALQNTDRPKRDSAITLHADFVHAPEAMEEMVKRLESGADLVVAELARAMGPTTLPERWARRWAPRLLRVAGLRDSLSGFVALRLSVLKQATRDGAPASLLTTDGWCANAELVARLAPHARRIETVPSAARYDLRQRPSRVKPWVELVAAWRSRGVIRAARTLSLALLAIAASARGQDSAANTPSAIAATAVVPFPMGERLTYQAKLGIFNVGTAVLEVVGLDTLRGIETIHFRFRISGGALWYHLDQTLESWVGRADFRSRRYHSDQEERDRYRVHHYEIFPDSGFYREEGQDSNFATVKDPLDDASFLYWIRTVPLEMGQRYVYQRYFRPDRNPVIIQVLKRERVSVAGRKWSAIVVRPMIPKGRGILGERQDTRLWLSDDPRRLVLALQSRFAFGEVTLKLKEIVIPEQP